MAPSPDKTSGFEYSKEKTVSDYPKSSRNKDRYRYTETAADIVDPGKNQQTYAGLRGDKSQ